jgi:uncharacterized protein YdeI (YjbR/CyaY-like superfamily)
MRSKTLKTFDARTGDEWRAWLAEHHHVESEVWLVFHKRHTGHPTIAYEDAVDEALCFGWIDSLIRRLDDHRYARKFTPRKPDSRWSTSNRRRYRQLKASGRLAPEGVKRAPSDRGYETPLTARSRVPAYIRQALKQRSAAWKAFENLAPSHRRAYLAWIDSAKRQETKTRRLQQAIGMLAAGKTLGLK